MFSTGMFSCCCALDADIANFDRVSMAEYESNSRRCVQPGEVFDVEIDVSPLHSHPLGVKFDFLDGIYAVVSSVSPYGLVGHWNELNPEKALKPMDHVVGVNGLNSDGSFRSMVEEINRTDVMLKMKVFRPPKEIVMSVNKSCGPLGLEFHEGADTAKTLMIAWIHDGLAKEWNAGEGKSSPVKPRDRIREVNGDRGNAAEMLEAIKSAHGEVSLRILSYTPLEEIGRPAATLFDIQPFALKSALKP